VKRLVLVGGGHAHIEVLRDLAVRPLAGVEVTLVTPSQRMLYTGMVPGVVAGHYSIQDCAIDLAVLAQRANAELLLTSASLVSPDANKVACADGTVLDYDVASLDVGSRSAIGAAKGVERHAVLLRPLERALVGWNGVFARAAAGEIGSVTIVGGGAAGIELALAMRHRFDVALRDASVPHVRLISEAAGVGIAAGAARRLIHRMRRAGVESQVGTAVKEVGEGFVRLESGLEFATDAVFWATGAAAHGWIRDSGFATDKGGFLVTNTNLQSVRYANVFGAGDCATVEGHEMPKAGVFAVRAGPVLCANLRAALTGGALTPHVPNPRYLALISTGRKHAVGTWGGLSWQGRWAWHWKDHIDRKFVERYRREPGEAD
jgi:pyridine nucleotide-disulfide oxidoreductase family protein